MTQRLLQFTEGMGEPSIPVRENYLMSASLTELKIQLLELSAHQPSRNLLGN